MQLKRDVDYSLRILLCIAKSKRIKNENSGLTIFELSKLTSISPTIISRLCCEMENANLLKSVKTSAKTTEYSISKTILNKTLFDVVQAIEGQNTLFSVFDKSTDIYFHCKKYFEKIENQFKTSLDSVTIKDLLLSIADTE